MLKYFSILAEDKNSTLNCAVIIDPIVDWTKLGKSNFHSKEFYFLNKQKKKHCTLVQRLSKSKNAR